MVGRIVSVWVGWDEMGWDGHELGVANEPLSSACGLLVSFADCVFQNYIVYVVLLPRVVISLAN